MTKQEMIAELLVEELRKHGNLFTVRFAARESFQTFVLALQQQRKAAIAVEVEVLATADVQDDEIVRNYIAANMHPGCIGFGYAVPGGDWGCVLNKVVFEGGREFEIPLSIRDALAEMIKPQLQTVLTMAGLPGVIRFDITSGGKYGAN